MFLDSSVRSTLTISLRPPAAAAERADVRLDVPGPGALPQRGRVHAERVHGHLGDVAPVGHPPDRAGPGPSSAGPVTSAPSTAAQQSMNAVAHRSA